jgi:hypothetical protein
VIPGCADSGNRDRRALEPGIRASGREAQRYGSPCDATPDTPATLTSPFTSAGKPPHAMPRRPLSKLMTRTTNATTSSKWMRPPPIWRLKPKSHKIPRTTKIVQSIFILLCDCQHYPNSDLVDVHLGVCSGCCSRESASFEVAMLSRIAHFAGRLHGFTAGSHEGGDARGLRDAIQGRRRTV